MVHWRRGAVYIDWFMYINKVSAPRFNTRFIVSLYEYTFC